MSVKLRDLEQSDLDLVYGWYNDPALNDTLVGNYVERSRGEALEYMQTHWINGDTTLRKIIMAGGTPVGLIALSHIDRSEGRAAIDIFITASTDRGKGYSFCLSSFFVWDNTRLEERNDICRKYSFFRKFELYGFFREIYRPEQSA